MALLKKYIGDLFLTNRFYMVMVACIIFFIVGFFFPVLGEMPMIFLQVFLALVLLDYFFLFFFGNNTSAKRVLPDRLSNGDENKIELRIKSEFSFPVKMQVIDELPEQLQIRDFKKKAHFRSNQQQRFTYTLRPVERGEYYFGNILLFVSSLLGLLERRITIDTENHRE